MAVPAISSNGSKDIWNDLLEDKLRKLRVKDPARLRDTLSYDAFQKSLDVLLSTYENKKPVKLLQIIKPAVECLYTFAHALNSISQGNPFAAIGWGVAQLLLESANQSYRMLSYIANYLEDFTKTLPRCSDYVALYPHHPRLRSALQEIYKIYVSVCIDTAEYLGRRHIVNMISVYLRGGQAKRSFDEAKAKVEECKTGFEREVNFAHNQETNQIHKAIRKQLLPRIAATKVTTLPFTRNASFVCREKVLERIEETLYPPAHEGRGTRSCVIHGMGGVGKTQTALEFAYRCSKPDCCIFWIRAETQAELVETFGGIAKVLDLAQDFEIQDQTQLVTLAHDWLSKSTNWLLIFDNVIDFQSIKPYWPSCLHGSVIVTTQNQELKYSATSSVHLKTLEVGDGAQLLLQYLNHDDEQSKLFLDDVENARAISKELEGLPIALAHVAGYIDQSKRPLSYFLEQFQERRRASVVWSMDSRSSTTQQYDRTLDAVWDLAFSALGEKARSLLDVLAMLNPDSIPEHMLLSEYDSDPIEFDKIRMELLGRHLVRAQGDTSGSALSIHRSLQKNLLFHLDRATETRFKVFERATKMIRKCFPAQSPIGVPVNHKWTVYEQYLPHVLALHTVYTESHPEIKANAEFAELLCDAGYYMWDRNLGWEGITVLETAKRICLTDENKHMRRLRANIGVAIGSLMNTIGISRLQPALQIFDEILELRKEHNAELPLPHSQEEQLLLSNAYNDKGWMCLESEDYLGSEEYFKKSLEIKRQWPEQDIPFEFAETIKNMALVRLAQQRSKDAIELVRHAVQLVEEDRDSGPESATMQKFRLYLAEILANSGQVKEAIDMVQKVAEGRKRLYRPHHPFNLDIYYVQGILFYYDGRFSEAEDMLRQSLDTDIRDPYPDECRARCLYAMAEVTKALGKEEAERHRKEAFVLLDQWRDLFVIETSKATDPSVLFDHVVPLKCTRLSKYGKLYVGKIM